MIEPYLAVALQTKVKTVNTRAECEKNLKHIGNMIAKVAKFAVFPFAIFETIRWALVEWFPAKIDALHLKIGEVMNQISVTLNVPTGPIAKVNTLIPLFEMWEYFLLWLALAATLSGVKWLRNIIPGQS